MIELQELRVDRVRALNILKYEERILEFEMEGDLHRFQFKNIEEVYIPSIQMVWSVAGEDVVVGLRLFPLLHLEAEQVDVSKLQQIPTAVAGAILEEVLTPWIVLLEDELQTEIILKSLNFNANQVVPGERLDFLLYRKDSIWVEGCLFASDSLLNRLVDSWVNVPLSAHSKYNQLAVALEIEVGRQWLSIKDWKSLRLQDIIIFSEETPENGYAYVTSKGQGLFLAHLENNRVVLEKSFSLAMENPGPIPASTVESLMLPIQFVLGQRNMTLAQMKALKPGFSIELPEGENRSFVKLIVNGQIIGEGELVEISGKKGVRLTAIGEAVSPSASNNDFSSTLNQFQAD